MTWFYLTISPETIGLKLFSENCIIFKFPATSKFTMMSLYSITVYNKEQTFN